MYIETYIQTRTVTLNPLQDRIHNLLSLTLPSQIRGQNLSFSDNCISSFVDFISGRGVAQTTEHESGGTDGGDRISNALAGNVWC